MKLIKHTPLFIMLLLLGACKKDDPLTKPVAFTETTYHNLASYDTSGLPSNLLPKDVVSTDMKTYISNTLPEHTDLRTTHPDLLGNTAIADITITQPSDVFLTFVSQSAGLANAVAFYTYPTNAPPASAKDIKDITYVFPNAGLKTKLRAGDKVKIGRFDVGTSIGFVLMQGAWNPLTKTLDDNVVHF